MPPLQGIFQRRDRTRVSFVSCTGRRVLYHQRHLGSPENCVFNTTAFSVELSNPLTRKRESKLTLAIQNNHLKDAHQGFPDSSVVKNLPAKAGNVGSIPGLGRSHMPWSNKVHVPQLLSLCSRARELQRLSPHALTAESHMPRACALQQQKPPQ